MSSYAQVRPKTTVCHQSSQGRYNLTAGLTLEQTQVLSFLSSHPLEPDVLTSKGLCKSILSSSEWQLMIHRRNEKRMPSDCCSRTGKEKQPKVDICKKLALMLGPALDSKTEMTDL